MPWIPHGPNQVEFKGPIGFWMQDFQAWYKIDARDNPSVTFKDYLLVLCAVYGNLAKEKWSKEWFGKKKIEKLDSFVSSDAEGNIHLEMFDIVDCLAENLDMDLRQEWGPKCRAYVREQLKLN
ncbi:MAG TPA: hypothetical protein VK582_13970 [Pyrinomonadaceae bacterium]|nr:hypothetical protein [Pyrinomonadaceae bacterium]